jgi:hypothetical protein
MRWLAELLGFRVTQSKESDAFASQGVERLIPPLLNPSFGPYRTDPELDLGVMPTHDVLLVGLRGGRPRIRQLGEGRLSL